MATGSIDVRVENQLVRFVCPTPLNHDAVVAEVGVDEIFERQFYLQ